MILKGRREEESLSGLTVSGVREKFGEPDASKANGALKKEIWVYMLNVDDSTARYVYFQDGKAVNTRNDEFNGTFESETWLSTP